MKAILRVAPGMPHQARIMQAFETGLRSHRIACEYAPPGAPRQGDFEVAWSAKNAKACTPPFLVLDAGYINGTGDDYVKNRMRYISANWDGAHGDGRTPPHCLADRWDDLAIELPKWKRKKRKALILAQHPNDVASGVNHRRWVEQLAERLAGQYAEVQVRPHPLVEQSGPLSDDLQWADHAYTYASTSAVEAVLAGVPTWTYSQSSIAWPVTAHEERAWTGDRTDWCHQLAYRQWTLGEILSGVAWDWLQWGLRYDETNEPDLTLLDPATSAEIPVDENEPDRSPDL